MQLFFYPKKYFSLKGENIKSNAILMRNLLMTLIGMFFITTIAAQLVPGDEDYHIFSLYAFISIILVPFYFIFNFIISLLYLLVLKYFHPAIKIGKFYVMILTYNTFIFLFNSISVNVIFLYEEFFVYVLIFVLSIVTNAWAGHILYWGLSGFAGFSKKVSLNFCITLFCLNIVLLAGGLFVNVQKFNTL